MSVPRFVITVEVACDPPLPRDPATVLTASQELALYMLTAATERAAAVTHNRGLLELLNKVH